TPPAACPRLYPPAPPPPHPPLPHAPAAAPRSLPTRSGTPGSSPDNRSGPVVPTRHQFAGARGRRYDIFVSPHDHKDLEQIVLRPNLDDSDNPSRHMHHRATALR